MESKSLRISYHARLRYRERIKCIDLEKVLRRIKQALSVPHVQQLIDFGGYNRFKIKARDGVTYCFEDLVVTTCYPTKSRKLGLEQAC